MIMTLVLIWLVSFVALFGILEYVSSDFNESFVETARPLRVLVLAPFAPIALAFLALIIVAIGVCAIGEWVALLTFRRTKPLEKEFDTRAARKALEAEDVSRRPPPFDA